jgi:hypothetical protein
MESGALHGYGTTSEIDMPLQALDGSLSSSSEQEIPDHRKA